MNSRGKSVSAVPHASLAECVTKYKTDVEILSYTRREIHYARYLHILTWERYGTDEEPPLITTKVTGLSAQIHYEGDYCLHERMKRGDSITSYAMCERELQRALRSQRDPASATSNN